MTTNIFLVILLCQLSEVFEQEIDPVMQALGYCCGRKYTFNPQVLCCFGKQLCTIPRDAKYYSYKNRSVNKKKHTISMLLLISRTTFCYKYLSYCRRCFCDIKVRTRFLRQFSVRGKLSSNEYATVINRQDNLPDSAASCRFWPLP